MRVSVLVSNSARLIAFEAALAGDPTMTDGQCVDCLTNGPVYLDPNPDLASDTYCASCVRARIGRLQAFLNGGGR